MVEVVFTDEDKKNLKVIAEELPKLRTCSRRAYGNIRGLK